MTWLLKRLVIGVWVGLFLAIAILLSKMLAERT